MEGNINYDVIPGNSQQVDTNDDPLSPHSGKDSTIVLVPTPSTDPNDPLNWTYKRKVLSITCVCVLTFGIGFPLSTIYAILTDIADATGITLDQLNTGTGYMYLGEAFGCLIFQPIALQYGKRPTYIFCIIATCLLCLWPPRCNTNGEWVAAKVIQGFVSAPYELLCEMSIADVSFQHELSKNMAIYATSLMVSNFFAPVIGGFISQGLGWEWVMWISAIWAAICAIFVILFMEETNYERKLSPDKLLEAYRSRKSNCVVTSSPSCSSSIEEKNYISTTALDEEAQIKAVLSRQSIAHHIMSNNEAMVTSDESDCIHYDPPKTFIQRLSITNGAKSKFVLWSLVKYPFLMAQFPPVLWGGFIYGASLVWFNMLNATEATILGGPPYNFSSSMTGLAYLSPTIFALIFQLLAGPTSDWLKISIARRRGGLSYPEDRFWGLTIYMVFGLLACMGWGVAAYYEVHWGILVVSMGVLGASSIFAIVIGCSYPVETYHELAGDAMVIVVIVRNLMAFGTGYGVTPWFMNMGYKNAFISAGFILFGSNATFLIMIATGQWWRKKLAKRYWKLVEQKRALEK